MTILRRHAVAREETTSLCDAMVQGASTLAKNIVVSPLYVSSARRFVVHLVTTGGVGGGVGAAVFQFVAQVGLMVGCGVGLFVGGKGLKVGPGVGFGVGVKVGLPVVGECVGGELFGLPGWWLTPAITVSA